MSSYVRIMVWSDYVCPLCYLEEPILTRLHSEFGRRVRIERRAFELRPEPQPALEPDDPSLYTLWTRTILPLAEARGMTLRQPPVQPRSRKALEAARFARRNGRGPKMHQALFQAFFEHGRDIGNINELASIGRAVGLNASRLTAALQRNDFSPQIVTDRREAEALGIDTLPAMLLLRHGDRRENAIQFTGAQPYEILEHSVLELLAKPPRSTTTSATPSLSLAE